MPPRVPVTDHAIVRYIERVMGVDRRTLEAIVVPELANAQVVKFGDGIFSAETHSFIVRGGVVTTVLPPGAQRYYHGRKDANDAS